MRNPYATSALDMNEQENDRQKAVVQSEPKKASYYLNKARYKPGVNISEMLNKQF